jgi:phage terminase small subunit
MKNKLSTQQKRFADGVLSGLHAGRAYEAAGYNSTGSTADVCASQLLRKPKVSEYIENIKTKATNSTISTVIERKEMLTRISKKQEKEDPNASRQAIAELNKMDGAYAAEKVEVEHKGGVLVVPMAEDLDEWEKNSIEQQEKLQQETIDI